MHACEVLTQIPGLGFAGNLIRWKAGNNKCLAVKHSTDQSSTSLQIWTCNASSPKQIFDLPALPRDSSSFSTPFRIPCQPDGLEWNRPAGGLTCGQRILNSLQEIIPGLTWESAAALDKASARDKIAAEFATDCEQCGARYSMPDCREGDLLWNRIAGFPFTCGQRIRYMLMDAKPGTDFQRAFLRALHLKRLG